jgi:hypothetical protein
MKFNVLNHWKESRIIVPFPTIFIECKKDGGLAFTWLSHTFSFEWGYGFTLPE